MCAFILTIEEINLGEAYPTSQSHNPWTYYNLLANLHKYYPP